MIRLYLKNYRPDELVQLYNSIEIARSTVVSDVPNNPAKDLDEILVYLSGYIDGKDGK